jgi:hephaestin
VKDVNAGLFGPMIVTGKGASKSDGSPVDVDREYIITLFEVNENESHYVDENIQTYMSDPDGVQFLTDPFGAPIMVSADPGMLGEYNLMESLNGFVFGNLPSVTMNVGERVRWYIMASTNFEVHAPHWHGNTVEIGKMRSDVGTLLTMGMLIADMVPDNPGKWLFHCHVAPHLQGGMVMTYDVQGPSLAAE